jgi:PAS domain S-box-containing protein
MSKAQPAHELDELRAQLREAQETLAAIRGGEVDALVITGPQGEQIYSLRGADYSARMLLQEMSEGALTVLPDGAILYCNRRFAEMVKLPHEKVIGASLEQFVGPTDRAALGALLHLAEQASAKEEIKLAVSDGSFAPAYCSVTPVQIAEQHCLSVIVTDLTEQKRNEEMLASGRLARLILDQADEMVVVCDQLGSIVEASRAAHEFYGDNVLHRTFDQVFSISTPECTPGNSRGRDAELSYEALIAQCSDRKTVHGLEVRLRNLGGETRDFLLSAGPLRDSHERVLGYVLTFSDVSEITAAQQVLRDSEQMLREQTSDLERQLIASGRLVSLGEITASMAHEFNNPLGIIMGFVEDMLSSTDSADPQYRSLQIIDEETKRCQKIIQGLMEFARPTAAAFRLTDIGSLIEKTLQMIDARRFKQKVNVATSIAPDLPSVNVDSQQIEQVLVNLYLNALDAMLEGGELTVGANLEQLNGSEPAMVITISDTGFGIEPGDLEKIFQPFFTARKKAGLGLGLSICERIIKNHGGKIAVESRRDEGTTFRLYLPVQVR